VSLSALGRSDKRAMSSRVGRVAGGLGGAAPRVAASVSDRAHATSDHAARELVGPVSARDRASSSGVTSPAFTANLRENEPAPEMSLRAAQDRKRRSTWRGTGSARTSGTKSSTHIEMR